MAGQPEGITFVKDWDVFEWQPARDHILPTSTKVHRGARAIEIKKNGMRDRIS